MSSPLTAPPLCHTEPEAWSGVLFVVLEGLPFHAFSPDESWSGSFLGAAAHICLRQSLQGVPVQSRSKPAPPAQALFQPASSKIIEHQRRPSRPPTAFIAKRNLRLSWPCQRAPMFEASQARSKFGVPFGCQLELCGIRGKGYLFQMTACTCGVLRNNRGDSRGSGPIPNPESKLEH
jgi:hypothetical protein